MTARNELPFIYNIRKRRPFHCEWTPICCITLVLQSKRYDPIFDPASITLIRFNATYSYYDVVQRLAKPHN